MYVRVVCVSNGVFVFLLWLCVRALVCCAVVCVRVYIGCVCCVMVCVWLCV